MPDIPLEIKMLVIRELSPNLRIFPARQVGDADAAYFCDLRAVCLVWPDTIAIIRKILFEKISLRPNDHNIDASLRNLCQALENDPILPTFIRTLEFSHQNTNEGSLFIPTASRPLFLSFLSFVPKMQKLGFLRLDNMHFHEETSTAFLNDLGVLNESSVVQLILSNNTFSISTFNDLFNLWDDLELPEVIIDTVALMPPSANDILNPMLLDIGEHMWDWDDDDTWTEWKVDRPRTAASCAVGFLQLIFSDTHMSGMLMLMDLLASHDWSPFNTVDVLEITVDDSSCLTMTATFVNRLNNIIRRYELSSLSLTTCMMLDEDAIGRPLHLAGVKIGHIRERLPQPDEDRLNWYVESLVAVPPDSRLREFSLELHVHVPSKEKDLGPQGIWRKLDAALSGEDLRLDTLTLHVFPNAPPNGAKALELSQLRTWLMENCFPQVTAKYFRCMQEETEGREMSALIFWIGGKQVDAWKH